MLESGYSARTESNKEELRFQSELITSASLQGGFGKKVSHFQLKGVLDLIIQLPGFSLVQVECKDFGVRKPGFKSMTNITEHQKAQAEKLNTAASGLVAFYAFRVRFEHTEFAFFSPAYLARFDHKADGLPYIRKDGNRWPDLTRVWQELGVARLDAGQYLTGAGQSLR